MQTKTINSKYTFTRKETSNGPTFYHFKSLDSTNLEAERFALSLNEEGLEKLKKGVVFVADTQSNGQGSFAKQWISENGGLYYSLLIASDHLEVENTQYLVREFGQATATLLKEISNETVELELPNDLIVGFRKIGGLLIKMCHVKTKPVLIIGIGINVNQVDFPENIQRATTSLKLLTNRTINRSELIINLTKKLLSTMRANLS